MPFRFQRFTIAHERCAHKVGTDGVLLGAWADLAHARHILDIGTGSGLIALMAAQRATQATVVGIDIDKPSIAQARQNVAATPFAERVTILENDIRAFTDAEGFDHILSNPPYHTETLLPPDARRARARHTAALSLPQLITHAARLLSPEGMIHLIIPTAAQNEVTTAATHLGLHLVRLTLVKTTAQKTPRRTLLTWQRTNSPAPLQRDTLVLTTPEGTRTQQHQTLTQDFYIR